MKTTFKLFLAIAGLGAIVIVACEKSEISMNQEASIDESLSKAPGEVPGPRERTFIFGTRSKPCDCDGNNDGNDGCDGTRGICIIIHFGIDGGNRPLGENIGLGSFTFTDPGKDIRLSILEDQSVINPLLDTLFTVQSDMPIPEAIIAGGYTIKQGVYPIDYSRNPLGEVVLKSK